MADVIELTADQVMSVVDKATNALRALTDQSLALFIVNGALIRELHKAGFVDMKAIGTEAARVTPNISPAVAAHIKALTGSAPPAPPAPPGPPTLTLIGGGKVDE